jgi:hypothetical protein
MKRLVLATAMVAAGVTALAQGSLDFTNFKSNAGINAPVFAQDGTTKLGAAYLGQLYAGPVGGALAPIGTSVAFRNDGSGNPTGYIVAGKVLVPTVAEGAKASVVFKAWEAAGGATFEAAQASGKLYGQSIMLEITTGGDNLSPPAVPSPLTGLTSFSLIPEPSTLALGMLGAAALLLRRRS